MSISASEGSLLQLNQERFDFNIQFEQLFFSIIPSAVFIIIALWRTLSQIRKPIVVIARSFQLIKVTAIAVYTLLQLALLALAAVPSFEATRIHLAASSLELVSGIIMITLSVVDHSRSPRPSVLLTAYLSLTLILDAARARTLFLSSTRDSGIAYINVFVTAVVLKAVILLLESTQKSSWVRWNEKDHSPEETSGIFSLGVFFWLNKLFRMGYKKILGIDDLYPLDSALDAKTLHDAFSRTMEHSNFKGKKHGLAKVLARTLWVSLLLPVLPRLALTGFTLCQPLFMERLLDHLSHPEPDANVGYGFIGASLFIYAGIAVSKAIYWYFQNRSRTMIRSVLVTEIFAKATEAGIGGPDDSAALTLMSTDLERIRVGLYDLHEVWASLIQAALAAWMLYARLGVVFVAPIGILLVCFTVLGFLVNRVGDSQRSWMAGVQKRVGMTATVITSMKNLKISGMTVSIGRFVQGLRVEELAVGALYRELYITAALLGFIAQLISPPVVFAFTQKTLDASIVFTCLAFISLLTYPLSSVFEGIPKLISALACIGRIQAFLEREARHDFRQNFASKIQNVEKASIDMDSSADSAVAISNGTFGWEKDNPILRNINIRLSKSTLTVVVGPVGSGKSTLIQALLGEVPFNEGSMLTNIGSARVGYCDQTAFLSNGSIRENIIGFAPFNDERYSEVIAATALGIDFATLEKGDHTNVGSNGITLSGGQKQRVSLARALYLQSDFLILDDVFSGLDADTEVQVFQQVFAPGGLLRLRGSTVILCTHSIKHLPAADYIVVLDNGGVIEQGSFAELRNSGGYVQRLDLKEYTESGASSTAMTPKDESTPEAFHIVAEPTLATAPESDISRQVGDRTVYLHYARSMGWFLAGLSALLALSWGFFTNFPTIWLTYWIDDVSAEKQSHPYSFYAGIYALLQISAIMSLLGAAWALWVVAIRKAGAQIHQGLLATLINAPLRFFTNTDTGVTTNLFSQDLNLIDTELPESALNTLNCIFQSLGQAAVMLVSSAYLAIAYPFIAAILGVIGRLYLRTSRQLRLLDLEAKSPLYTHFLDTVRGVVTLRAFGYTQKAIEKNAHLTNTSQRPAYLLMMIQEWLNLVLNIIVMLLAVALVALSVQLHSKSTFAGAALYSLITLGENLAGIVVFYTRLETSIGAIARVKTFNESVKPEDREEEDIVPLAQWPEMGVVELNGVSAGYVLEDESNPKPNLALRDIHLTINSGEKVAICGRTGSGKSSLVALILKLLDSTSATSANAIIDGTPLHRINRAALRQRIIAVPQEAVLLPDGSTFQTNLDPDEVSSAEECKSVLASIGLWDFVEERGGLNAGMSAGTLSAGQRQLVSVGRALLRRRIRAQDIERTGGASRGGILLLDEVSSSVDHDTERVIQNIISSEFGGYTVIAVSHRLEMIMDFDRVVVMDAGEIVEVGNPRTLAGETGTRFGDLVRAGEKEGGL